MVDYRSGTQLLRAYKRERKGVHIVRRSTKEKSHPLLKASDLNLWFARYNSKHPDLADDIKRACEGSEVSWERIFIFGAVRSDAYKKTDRDLFGCESQGRSLEDQVISATIAWGSIDDMKFLSTSEVELQKFDALWSAWLAWRDPVLRMRDKGSTTGDQPLPPIEVPEPTKPVELPLPKKDIGWWTCPSCKLPDNPPTTERCMRCSTINTSARKQPTPVPESGKQDDKLSWKEKLKGPLKVLAGIAGVLTTLSFLFPPWLKAGLVAVKVVLESLINSL